MWTQAMWDCILRWLRKARIHRQPARRPHYVLLHLEYLTERIVPTNTACTFLGTVNDDWGLVANWSVINNQNTMPDGSGTDTATIAPGVTCVLSTDANIAGLTVSANATLTVGADLKVQPNGSTIGNGTSSVAAGGVLNIGSTTDSGADAKLDTNTFNDLGTTTVGGPSTGSSGTLDAVVATLGNTSGAGGILNIGAASNGLSGDVTITNTMTVNSAAALFVGGPGNSGGTLDVQALTSMPTAPGTANVTINPEGTLDVGTSATFNGDTIVTGLLDAKNIDAFSGAAVTLAGPGSVGGTGQLEAGVNASIIFGPASTWTLLPDSAVGGPLKEGQFFVNGPLSVAFSYVNSDADITLNDDGSTTFGSIGGSGSMDWFNGQFNWNGGTISVAGGFINENGDFKLQGANAKFLSTVLTNTGAGIADFDGAGTLWLMTGGKLLNEATPILPMEMSLPLVKGFASDGMHPGVLDNAGTIEINGSGSGVDLDAPLVNEVAGVLDCATGAAPLTLSDISGTSVLNGKIGLNNDSLTISGLYTTTSGAFEEEFSASDVTTLTGTLTIDSGASADFDHLILTSSGGGSGGLITGAGDFSIDADGGGSNDYLTWMAGSMTGTGTTTIGPNATLTLSGTGAMGRNLDNHGKIVWPAGGTVGFGSGVTVHNEKDGTIDLEGGGFMPTLTNDGLLEVAAGVTPTVTTFTQSSTGTLQSDIASAGSVGTLKVTGSATLDGTLQAQLEDGYQPPSGTLFGVLTFTSSSGQFATIDPQGWSATYAPTSVSLVSP